MANTIADEILVIVKNEIKQIPTPIPAKITKIYDDIDYADILLDTSNEILKYVRVIGDNHIGVFGVCIFINGDYTTPLFVADADLSNYYTKSEVDDLITGDKDLDDYVKKADVRLKFDLEDNGTVILGIDVGDGF